MNEIEKNIKEYEAACYVISACATAAIKQVKDIVGVYNNSVEVSLIAMEMGVESISVAYDGGNHPEYDSNVFSEVERVYVREDRLFVETEDADIEFSDLSSMEEMTILQWLYEYHKDGTIKKYYTEFVDC